MGRIKPSEKKYENFIDVIKNKKKPTTVRWDSVMEMPRILKEIQLNGINIPSMITGIPIKWKAIFIGC